ncbi:MAG TPA: amino acid adenylation domain-containing protein [Micromonosporaceae bacterium]
MSTSIEQKRRALLELRLRERRARRAELERITPVPRDEPLACSYQQEGLWFLHQLDPDSPVYHVPWALRLRGELDIAALRRALAGLVARHESLRTRFGNRDGVPFQVVDPPPDDWQLPVSTVDRAGLAEWLTTETRRPFDLEHGPLFRSRLARLATDEHLLLLTMHHIVGDGWSLSVMNRELGELYDAARSGTAGGLPALDVQAADHAAWQRRWLSGERLERELGHWHETLRDVPTVDFPTDRPRPVQPTGAGAVLTQPLPGPLATELRDLARREQVSFLAVLLAGFLVVLHRYTGQPDLTVGSVFSGRTRSETEPLVGFFANTLVLRTSLAGEPTFQDLVQRCNATVLDATAHQEVPFGLVVDALNPERVPGRNPLFQISFTLQAAAVTGGQLRLGDLSVGQVGVIGNRARFDLAVAAVEHPDGHLDFRVEYSTELFDQDRVARLVRHVSGVLESAVCDPRIPVGELELMSETERRQVLRDWNPRPVREDGTLLHELVAERAGEAPNHVAMRFQSAELRYGELDRRANRLAHHLVGSGVAPGDVVGVLLERGFELPIAELGILRAGAAWLPLDPQYPTERLGYQLADAGARLAVTTSDLADRLPAGVRPVPLDVSAFDHYPATPPPVRVHPEDVAYVIYTSGSTGRPKGVMVPHRAAVRFCRNLVELFRMGPSDRVLQFANPAFDISVSDFFATFTAGATVVGAPRGTLHDPDKLQVLMRDERVTFGDIPPAVLRLLDPEPLTDLRSLFIGMEPFGPELVNRWQRPGREFHNGYGPTEVAMTCVDYKCPDEPLTGPPPIGRAMANHRAYVLDPRLRPVPIGVPGELYMAGAGLAHGYLGRPDFTAEKFLPDPFCDQPGQRMYATGDLVRWNSDGNLEFLSRVDRQVKIRGLRVELGEIEHVINSHPSVQQCAVTVRNAGTPTAHLVGYLVPQPGDQVDPNLVREYLADRLPLHMIPAPLLLLSELPLTATGKLDHRRLPAPEPEQASEYTAPETDTQRGLAEIWQRLLGLDEPVGRHDDFFKLGGNSLRATQLISRIRDGFGVAVDPRQLFSHPVLEQLARLVNAAETATGDRIARVAREGPLACSYQQEGLWFLQQLDPGSSVYHIPIALRIHGGLDLVALRTALRDLVRRHESLRTRFVADDSAPYQVIEPPPAELPLPVADLDRATLDDWLRKQAHRPFDLAREPGFRALLARVADDEHVLLLVLHHIIADGWAVGVITSELSTLYRAARSNTAPTLPELPVQPADHAAWQRRSLSGNVLGRQLGYWRQRLADLPDLEFPTDRARPAQPAGTGAVTGHRLPGALAGTLRELARQERTSLLAVLLAGFLVVLHRYTGQRDLAIGSVFSGRTSSELEPLVGYFANTLVLRTSLAGDPSFQELVRRCNETVLGATAHQDVPFGTLVEALRPERVPGRNPLFQVSLTLQAAGTAGTEVRLGDSTVEPVEVARDRARFDIAISAVDPGAGHLDLTVEFSTELFEPDRIERLLGHLETVLRQAVAAPDAEFGDLAPLTDPERADIAAWGARRREVTADESLYRLFAEQARRHPDAVAVVAGEERVSYRDLEQRAGRVAAGLAALGVQRCDLVGLCLPRTAGLVAGILGILRAGAAYLPLDPDQPAERLRFMLTDSGVRVVLSHPDLELPEGHHTRLEITDLPPDPTPAVPVTGADLAYLVYTSGSTGRPKAVMIAHRNVVRLLRATEDWFGFDHDDVWTMFHSAAFDFSVWELWGALGYGGRLVVVRYWETRSPERFYDLLLRERVTVLNQTPAAFRQLVAVDEQHDSAGELALRTVIFGGEALDPDSVLRWFDRHGERRPRLVNMYGITETTVHVTYQPLSRELLTRCASPIGVPLPDLSVRVVDPAGGQAPVGVPGELWVGGAGVGYGYLGRPELTAERFVPDRNGCSYRSGDLVRWLSDGTLEYLGRVDQQVKIRGFRIELGEIEAVLTGHPDVADAVVARYGDAGNPRLVAYLVAQRYDEAELRTYLSARLPSYMVPTALVRLDAIPLTGNGKVDRRALPAPQARAGSEFIAPRTDLERALTEVWSGTLGPDRVVLDRLSVLDNFFDLGGNSLDLVRLGNEIRRVFGVGLDPRNLYAAPTVAAMAVAIQDHSGALDVAPTRNDTVSPLVPMVTGGDLPPLFFVHAVGGSVGPYGRLASLLGPDQPFYGLEDPGLHGGDPALTLRQAADRYVAAIREVQPEGPYHLGGWSMGGAVALEMARQLRAAGQRVALLVVVDTGLPAEPYEPDQAEMLTWFVRDVAGIARTPVPVLDLDGLRQLSEEEQIVAALDAMTRADLIPEGLLNELTTRIRVFAANYRALLAHRPEPYPGRLVLVNAADEPAEDLRRWRALASEGLEHHVMPGDHYTMLQPPHVSVLGDTLRQCLRKARAEGGQ